jgi:hypothetical protein
METVRNFDVLSDKIDVVKIGTSVVVVVVAVVVVVVVVVLMIVKSSNLHRI